MSSVDQTRVKRRISLDRDRIASLIIWGVFVAFVIPVGIAKPQFVSLYNIVSILMIVSVYALLGFGQTFVILTAGIDLSVGSTVGLAGVVAAIFMETHSGVGGTIGAIALGSASGFVVGLFNGVLIGILNMPPFVATLGTLSIVLGTGYVISSGLQITITNNAYLNFTQANFLHIPVPVYIMFLVFVVLLIVLNKTSFGRKVYAVGGNIRAAFVAGMPIRRVLVSVYTLSGLLAGVAGVILASQVTAGIATTGAGYELTAIAAPVIGGVSLMGGKGSLWGALFGVILLGAVDNGLDILNVSPFYHEIIKGFVIVSAVYIDTVVNRRKLIN